MKIFYSDWLWNSRWDQVLQLAPQFVEIITWNGKTIPYSNFLISLTCVHRLWRIALYRSASSRKSRCLRRWSDWCCEMDPWVSTILSIKLCV